MLESATDRARAMTVDRAKRIITVLSLGLVALTLVSFALIFFFVGTGRILGEVTDKVCGFCGDNYMEYTYAFLGGLFLIAGAFLWRMRTEKPGEEPTDE